MQTENNQYAEEFLEAKTKDHRFEGTVGKIICGTYRLRSGDREGELVDRYLVISNEGEFLGSLFETEARRAFGIPNAIFNDPKSRLAYLMACSGGSIKILYHAAGDTTWNKFEVTKDNRVWKSSSFEMSQAWKKVLAQSAFATQLS